MNHVAHTFEPIYDEKSKILILGTMPSPKSRENGFYYSHPQNAFWKLMATLLKQGEPVTAEEKKVFALKNGFALWDVLASCDIEGASDSSIRNAVVNDLSIILAAAPIQVIFTTGKKASELYRKLCFPETGLPSVYLSSTSPANRGRFPLERLLKEWKVVVSYLK